MGTFSTILVVDSNPDDRALSKLLLERELPDAAVTAVPGALELAEALLGRPPDVAVVAGHLQWFKAADLFAAIRRHHPATALVLFGKDWDAADAAFAPGLAVDGVIEKSAAGFLALANLIADVLSRSRRLAPVAARASTPVPVPTRASVPPRQDEDLREATLMFSHDLKQPVQQIVRLARQGRAADREDAGRRALQHVLECAERAAGMLDGMIEYFALTQRPFEPAPIDLNRCLTQAIHNLRGVIEEAHADIRVASLPSAVGDERQLTHVFQNILSNAITFRREKPPLVFVGVETRADGRVLTFKDNGIGIAEGAIERIFELGARLHTREEYPGSGIGLALCRRIVERHGGRIWVESREGRGSTFYVMLPAAPVPPARGVI